MFQEIKRQADKEWNELWKGGKTLILIGTATCGRSAGSLNTKISFEDELSGRGVDANIIEVGCMGPCYAEPLVCIMKPDNPGICYRNITPEKAKDLVDKYITVDGEDCDPITEYALGTIGNGTVEGIPRLGDIPVFKPQERRLFEKLGYIDPININHYIAYGGYSGLAKALEMEPTDIIEEVKKSGLRGRGGGGFPTGRKWEASYVAKGDVKYIVCNADEGDPGAFMDRSVIEGDPHAILEGMIIAGYTIGAKLGYIYVRAEYPLAVETLNIAIKHAEDKGVLGKNILGTGFDFEIVLFKGAGAFVCGESTALTQSIEGKRGIPKGAPRPRTTEKGLFGKPTILNNVKTFGFIPLIINKGAEWFAEVGTENSKGTAVFALTGKVNNCGLIEVPMGISLREIVFDIGGGIPNGKKFKAVQTGGPSGGCLPESLLDTPVDYDSLKGAGAIMGSGGMVVMDEDTCMVDIAAYFLDFTEKESCGQCAPCRLGTKQMLDILLDITAGKGKIDDVDLLVEVGEAVITGSMCGLGTTAPNPALTTIRYFRNEYETHIEENKCLARVCKPLLHYSIVPDNCISCGICARACPVDAISGSKDEPFMIDQERCIKCGLCVENCPSAASAAQCFAGITIQEET
jgi:NADH-quinone oxidoreductase subunit F